jgi:hypothetical protein
MSRPGPTGVAAKPDFSYFSARGVLPGRQRHASLGIHATKIGGLSHL